jgi:phage tail-like protein
VSNDSFDSERITGATFLFEVEDIVIGHFMEVSGLQVDIAVESVEEGGQNGFVHQLPGRMSWPPLVLKRGITQTDSLIAWLRMSSGEQFAGNGNKLKRHTGAVTLLGPGGKRLRSWSFDGAFPTKWSGPTFAASSNDLPTEELTIVHNGFKAKDVAP